MKRPPIEVMEIKLTDIKSEKGFLPLKSHDHQLVRSNMKSLKTHSFDRMTHSLIYVIRGFR